MPPRGGIRRFTLRTVSNRQSASLRLRAQCSGAGRRLKIWGVKGLLLRPERIGGVHDLHKQAVAERRDGVVRTHLCAAVRAALRPSTMLLGFILLRGGRLRQFGNPEHVAKKAGARLSRRRTSPLPGAYRGKEKEPTPSWGWPAWCGRWDLNPYVIQHTPLKRACLPIPALPHIQLRASAMQRIHYKQIRTRCQAPREKKLPRPCIGRNKSAVWRVICMSGIRMQKVLAYGTEMKYDIA